MLEDKHFLYRHIRLDNNEPFYIGIGTKKKWFTDFKTEYRRAFEKTGRNIFWKRIINKTNYEVEILFESNDYEFIKNKEIELIQLYGKRWNNTGTLVNITDGGEGVSGYTLPDWHKKRLSEARTGTFKNGTKIYQYDKNGNFVKEWRSIAEADRFFNSDNSAISKCINNKNNTSHGFYWSKIKYDNFVNPVIRDTIPIFQYDLDGNFIREWKSVKEAAAFYNVTDGAIESVLLEKTISSVGYIWKREYKNKVDKRQPRIKLKQINQLSLSNDILNSFSSMRELYETLYPERKFKVIKDTILKVLNNNRKTAFGYKWQYIKDNE